MRNMKRADEKIKKKKITLNPNCLVLLNFCHLIDMSSLKSFHHFANGFQYLKTCKEDLNCKSLFYCDASHFYDSNNLYFLFCFEEIKLNLSEYTVI